MIRTSSLYEACQQLFVGYPLAARTVNRIGPVSSMVLMLQDGGDGGFFVLTRDHAEGQPFYSLSPWRSPGSVDINLAADSAVPDLFANAIAHGVPIPRHGSLFGWDDGGAITALIAVYAKYTLESPAPTWATMPLTGIPEAQWPPFTDERLFGQWFWERYRARNIVALGGLIAGTPDTVFWADTKATLGSDCCIVARDIRSTDGHTLSRGRYVYYQALRAGKPVPSLRVLLAGADKIDLAPRFRPHGLNGEDLAEAASAE
jgi:hypothetical protein